MKRGLAHLGTAAVLAVVACRQIVGIGDQPPGPGAADAGSAEGAAACGGFPWDTPACGTCVEGACCAEATACRGDVACARMFDCMAKCAGSDDVCRNACVPLAPDTATLALAACQSRSCSSECDLVCGGFFGLTGAAPGPCLSCFEAQACTFATHCAQNEGCLAVLFCGQACLALDVVCNENCSLAGPSFSLSPDAGQGFAPGVNACATECGLGTTWTCAGQAAWPIATATTISFELAISDGFSGGPLAGVAVAACRPQDQDCTAPLSTGMTDSSGLVTLTSSLVPFSGYLQLTAPGYVTELLYEYPSLAASTDPGVTLAHNLLSTTLRAQLAAAAGIALDPSLGIINANPRDCTATPAAGVSFTLEEVDSGSGLGSAARPFYYVGSSPTTLATATSLPVAAGGFINVAPGLVTFVASESGTTVDTVSAYVRGDGLTTLNLVPTP